MSDRIDVKEVTEGQTEPKKRRRRGTVSRAERANPGNQIYVRLVKGVFQRIRRYSGWALMGMFVLLPFLRYGDRQGLLLDVANRQFHFFGLTLYPQDLILLAFFFMIAAFALFFFTTFLGRIWCGYTCPQTVWTFIFIWLEEKFEGQRNKRMRLDQLAWDRKKLLRKSGKHLSWLLVSLLTGISFVSYFVDVREIYSLLFIGELGGTATGFILFFTLATYANAGWMRTIVCTHMCPYARFQSAMFDKDTFIVGYDATRGEQRGPRRRKQDPKALGLGDCVDCNLCVEVCPAGIDIRDGLQYECINCGACIDACDQTMDRMGYERKLIAYTTEHQLQGQKSDIWRPKLVGYGLILLTMMVAFVLVLASLVPLQLDILRDRNQLFRETSEGLIENVYTLKILNKSQQRQRYTLSLSGLDAFEWHGPSEVEVASGEVLTLPISVAVDPYDLTLPITDVTFQIQQVSDPEVSASHDSRFISGGR